MEQIVTDTTSCTRCGANLRKPDSLLVYFKDKKCSVAGTFHSFLIPTDEATGYVVADYLDLIKNKNCDDITCTNCGDRVLSRFQRTSIRCVECKSSQHPGTLLVERSTTGNMPDWYDRCDDCSGYADDLAALNAVRKAQDKKPFKGHPYSLVDAEYASPVEQTFHVAIHAALTLRTDGPCQLSGINELAKCLAENLEDWILAHGRGQATFVDCLQRCLEIEDVELINTAPDAPKKNQA